MHRTPRTPLRTACVYAHSPMTMMAGPVVYGMSWCIGDAALHAHTFPPPRRAAAHHTLHAPHLPAPPLPTPTTAGLDGVGRIVISDRMTRRNCLYRTLAAFTYRVPAAVAAPATPALPPRYRHSAIPAPYSSVLAHVITFATSHRCVPLTPPTASCDNVVALVTTRRDNGILPRSLCVFLPATSPAYNLAFITARAAARSY